MRFWLLALTKGVSWYLMKIPSTEAVLKAKQRAKMAKVVPKGSS